MAAQICFTLVISLLRVLLKLDRHSNKHHPAAQLPHLSRTGERRSRSCVHVSSASLLAGLLALAAPAAWSAPLVGWYKFNDSTDLGKDYSGYGYHGSVSGALPPLYTASGYSGGAADFQGGGRIQVPFNTGPNSWPYLTWGGWVKPRSFDGIRQIVTNDDGGFDRAIGIDVRSSGNYSAFVGETPPYTYNTAVAPSDAWIFVAGVYDNNFFGAGQGSLTLYVGSQVFSNIPTAYGNTGWTFTSIGDSPTFGEYWDGLIDEFFVIGGAVTPDGMATIMADPSSIPTVAAATPNTPHGAPSPLPLLGALAGLRASRVLRRRIRSQHP